MEKTAKLIKDHLQGKQTKNSKKVVAKIFSVLKKAGYKPPFKMKIAGKNPYAVFDWELPDGIPVTVTAYVYPEIQETHLDQKSDEEVTISLSYKDTKEEVPEGICDLFSNFIEELEKQVLEKYKNDKKEKEHLRAEEMRNSRWEKNMGM